MLLRARLGGLLTRLRGFRDGLGAWWRQRATLAIVALAAALVAAAAVYVVQELRLREQRIAVNNHEAQMRAVFTAPDATMRSARLTDGGTLTWIGSWQRDSAVVVLMEATPAGVDKAYQVWLLDGSNSQPVGLLAPNQISATLLVTSLGDATSLGVTVEQAAGAMSPTLPLIAEIPITR